MSDWPWQYVTSFKAFSCADGTVKVEPQWNPERVRPYTEDNGGGPGLGLRMAVAEWVEERLKKRGTR